MYSLNIFNCNDNMFYEIGAKSGSIFNLIKDIDNNDLSFIEKYKHEKYDNYVNTIQDYLGKYLKLNRKSIKHNINEISYCLTLFLLVLFYEEFIEDITYEELKSKLYLFSVSKVSATNTAGDSLKSSISGLKAKPIKAIIGFLLLSNSNCKAVDLIFSITHSVL